MSKIHRTWKTRSQKGLRHSILFSLVEKDLCVDKYTETAISFPYPHASVSNREGTFGDFSSLLPELYMTNV